MSDPSSLEEIILYDQQHDLRVIIEQCGEDNKAWKAEDLEMDPVIYHVLGVAGEAGEVANAFKKLARPGIDKQAQWALVVEEMADTLTHLCALAALINLDLADAFWEKREINLRRFGNEGGDHQSGITAEVRRQQRGSVGASAFVLEGDVQIQVREEGT